LVDDLRAEGWEVVYDVRFGAERLPAWLETAFYRVAQEALSNIRIHAGATRVHVTLRRTPQRVYLKVRDWGRGFEVDALQPSAEPGVHVGLAGMRKRMALVGG
jgi:two-component system NarL family sensor kinase